MTRPFECRLYQLPSYACHCLLPHRPQSSPPSPVQLSPLRRMNPEIVTTCQSHPRNQQHSQHKTLSSSCWPVPPPPPPTRSVPVFYRQYKTATQNSDTKETLRWEGIKMQIWAQFPQTLLRQWVMGFVFNGMHLPGWTLRPSSLPSPSPSPFPPPGDLYLTEWAFLCWTQCCPFPPPHSFSRTCHLSHQDTTCTVCDC